MSVLKRSLTTPSRVAAVYRYLLQHDRPRVARDTVQAVLSPATLPNVEQQAMIAETIGECLRMGLLVEDEESRVGINPDLPSAARDRRYGMARLPLTITDLVLRGNEENQDLARLLAWYLAQDVGSAPGDWESLSPVLGRQVGSERLDLTNNARFGQFKYWVCFLGFGWCHVREGKEWLVPDPTAHLRRRMAEIFGSDSRLSPAQAMQRLAEVCPVFEGGWARRDVEDQIGQRPERTISSATAHAWFRLQDEGLVEVEARSADADVLLFPEGERTVRCSALIRRKTGGAR